jgi:ribosomal protein S18 acetylase RimI-like enzyme
VSSYRFCRTDDVPLLVDAYNACYRPHAQGTPEMTVGEFRRLARESGLWASSCMVAIVDGAPVAVLFATKGERESLVLAVGVRPGHERRGHGRHLVESLAAKLAILGPPRLVAEVPEDHVAASAFLMACGFRRERDYRDFVFDDPRSVTEAVAPSPVAEVSLDELVEAGAFDREAERCWERAPETLLRRRASLTALALAYDTAVDASLVFDDPRDAGERRLLAFQCASAERRGALLRVLAAHGARAAGRSLRFPRVHEGEIPFGVLAAAGFRAGAATGGYVAVPG